MHELEIILKRLEENRIKMEAEAKKVEGTIYHEYAQSALRRTDALIAQIRGELAS